MSTYRVHSGDTMSGIAAKHHVSLKALEHANHQVHNPNLIYVGEKLHIPGKSDSFHNGPAHHPAHHASAHHGSAHHASAHHGSAHHGSAHHAAHRPHDPVKRLNQDLHQMHQAQGAQKKDLRGEKKAQTALTHDRAAEKTALGKIDTQRQTLESQILAAQQAGQPPSAQQLQQLADLGRQQVKTQDTFEQKLASDKKAIAHEKKALAHDKKAFHTARRHALKDLKPAEYHLSLKQTNKDRKLLGLKALKHALRPEIKNVVGGRVGKWIAQAQAILKQHGVPLSKMNAHDINIIIQHESSGNPNAINRWDSNAAAGHPSEGLMQTIGPTFNSYKLPGHGHILNPVDNIIAGVRYAISRYGSISNVPGVRNVHAGRAYVGY